MNPLLAANFEPLIPFVVFFVFLTLSLLHAAWKRSQRSDQSEPGGWDRPGEILTEGDEVGGGQVVRRYVRPSTPESVPPAPRQLTPWEEELERLLRGDGPPARPVPEPVVAAPPVAPPPLGPVHEKPASPRPVTTWVAVGPAPMPKPVPPPVTLVSARVAPAPVESLKARAQSYLQRTDGRPRALSPPPRPGRSPDIAAVVTRLQSRQTARQAILAAVILGPPKALES